MPAAISRAARRAAPRLSRRLVSHWLHAAGFTAGAHMSSASAAHGGADFSTSSPISGRRVPAVSFIRRFRIGLIDAMPAALAYH